MKYFIAVCLVLGLAMPAQATLIDRGLFDDGFGGLMNLIYDDDLNITWLGDANFAQTSGFDADGRMTWASAMAWVDSLTVGGFTDWRLPTTTQPDPTCSTPGGGSPPQGFGFGCTGSEMGHLANVEGIKAPSPDPFSNLSSEEYWSGTEHAPSPVFNAWDHQFGFNPVQGILGKNASVFVLVVRDGDVAPIPEPSTILLFGSGLVVLAAWRYRKGGKV